MATLIGTNGNDTLYGVVDESNLISGRDGDDYLIGGNLADTIYGGNGNDVILGMDGNDLLMGDTGNDILEGGDGRDRLYAGDGNDSLCGGTGNDYLDAGTGDDKLWGGDGNDQLIGRAGNDFLDGEAGSDSYLGYGTTGFGHDTIHDATAGDINNVDVLYINAFHIDDLTFRAIDTSGDGYYDALKITVDETQGADTITILKYFNNTTDNLELLARGGGALDSVYTSDGSLHFADVKAILNEPQHLA